MGVVSLIQGIKFRASQLHQSVGWDVYPRFLVLENRIGYQKTPCCK